VPAASRVNIDSRPSERHRRQVSRKASARSGVSASAVPARPFQPERSRRRYSSTAPGSSARSTQRTSPSTASVSRRVRLRISASRRAPRRSGHPTPSGVGSRERSGLSQCSWALWRRESVRPARRRSEATGPSSCHRSSTRTEGRLPPGQRSRFEASPANSARAASSARSGSTSGVPRTGSIGTVAGSTLVVTVWRGRSRRRSRGRSTMAARYLSSSSTTKRCSSRHPGRWAAQPRTASGSNDRLGSTATAASRRHRCSSTGVIWPMGMRRASIMVGDPALPRRSPGVRRCGGPAGGGRGSRSSARRPAPCRCHAACSGGSRRGRRTGAPGSVRW
jgi:hypothetical protein